MNFQKHRKRSIKFGKGLTIIAGNNGAGKSCLIRGITAVILNTMSVKQISRGSKLSKVSLRVDGQWIRRRRSKQTNSYQLADGKHLVAFKTGVPDVVASLLQVLPENVQRQSDGLFWLSESPGKVAKEVNLLANCGKIDEAAALLRKKQRDIVGRLQEVSEQRQDAERELAGLDWVEPALQHFKRLDSIEVEQEALRTRCGALGGLIEEMEAVDRILEKGAGESLPALVAELSTAAIKLRTLQNQTKEIGRLCQQIENVESQKHHLERRRSELAASLNAIKRCPLCQQTTDRWLSSAPTSI